MGRAWRIEYEGALYHVMSRGNEGNAIFLDDKDRRLFLDTLGDASERFELAVFAYVMMPNHYHLLLRTQHANLSRAMQWFGTAYTRRFNNRHSRSGHLFQGRFKSIIIQNNVYLMRLSCYIHRNPLKAGIVDRLSDYRWSSYPVYAYGKKPPEWLSTRLIWSQFRAQHRHRAYRQKVQGYAKEEKQLLEDLRHGFILGTARFVEKIKTNYLPGAPRTELPQQRHVAKAFDPETFVNKAAKRLGCDVGQFVETQRLSGRQKEDRDLLIYLLWRTGGLTNERIGDLFNMTYSSVSHCVRSIQKKIEKNQDIRNKYKKLNSQIKV